MKIKFSTKGAFRQNFGYVDFYFDGNGYTGDVVVKNHIVYVKDIPLPIRKGLAGAVFNDFIQAYHSRSKYNEMDYIINSDGSYMKHVETSNRFEAFMDKIFGTQSYSPPSLPEKKID